jgi:hypothetical protein
MPNSNAGIANALKMREMFLKDKYTRCSLEVEAEPFKIRLDVHPFNGRYTEVSIATYRFREDGSYTKSSHN